MADNLHKVLTRNEAIEIFNTSILPDLIQNECSRGTTFDGPMWRETWNNWTDSLCKDGQISDWQYSNWTQPECCER